MENEDDKGGNLKSDVFFCINFASIRGDISKMFVCLLLVFKVAALRGAFVCAVLHRGQ